MYPTHCQRFFPSIPPPVAETKMKIPAASFHSITDMDFLGLWFITGGSRNAQPASRESIWFNDYGWGVSWMLSWHSIFLKYTIYVHKYCWFLYGIYFECWVSDSIFSYSIFWTRYDGSDERVSTHIKYRYVKDGNDKNSFGSSVTGPVSGPDWSLGAWFQKYRRRYTILTRLRKMWTKPRKRSPEAVKIWKDPEIWWNSWNYLAALEKFAWPKKFTKDSENLTIFDRVWDKKNCLHLTGYNFD